MECSLYNAERRKKPVTCIHKVCSTSSPFRSQLRKDICRHIYVKNYKYNICIWYDLERYSKFSPAFLAADQEKAAASLLSNPISPGPPAGNQKSKQQQQAELWKPDGLRQWRCTPPPHRLSIHNVLRFQWKRCSSWSRARFVSCQLCNTACV